MINLKIAVPAGRGACILLLLLGCPVGAQDDHAGHDHGEEAVAIELSDRDRDDYGIVVEGAGPGVLVRTLVLPGEIHPDDDNLAHLTARYDGVVTEVRARIGDRVVEGQVLAVIESDESLAPYPLKTMIGGTVIEKHITLGEAVSRDTRPFVVADLDTVWLDLFVNQRDLQSVVVGQPVRVEHRPTGTVVGGMIGYVAPVIDEDTRTATARVVLDNAGGRWRPGMFVTGTVEIGRRDVPLAVPLEAVFTVHEHPVVFVEGDHGFEPREVVLGEDDGRLVEIRAGLEPGDRIVVSGGFTLKAELEKSGFDDGHNH
ncbi:MAG: efflux RND transporter periplasmic adaptor subunit [bacterium]